MDSLGVKSSIKRLLSTGLLLLFFVPAGLAQPAENLRVTPPPGGLLLTQPQLDFRPDLGLPQFPDVNVNPTPTAVARQIVTLDEDDSDEPALTLILFALIGSLAVLAACVAMLLTTRRGAL